MSPTVLATVSQQTAVVIIVVAVLVAVFVLALSGIGRQDGDQKFILGVIGLLLGLFGGGGIGAVVGAQTADKAANSVKEQVKTVATQAASKAATSVKNDVTTAVKSRRTP